ncbi:Zn-dependent exopeptidase [Hyaloscypha bicolor E]|uniref:Zn-dependent exopeptidase n=1 Tax=Hyaloscypha bicolor E TaxID=1095630 RepID=A0A2J6TSA4_9HELO|nr:Zn-dependent exopeptidase [Hyaloscypha bicolor E]PMD65899.1 Zn-dependent exopeptidase [Hyaloscypha bicolor E]
MASKSLFLFPSPSPTCRLFSMTSRRNVRTTEMSDEQLAAVKINRERLWKDLHSTCEWGKGERWGDGPTDIGMSRLTLSDADKQVRDWFVETTKSLGCDVNIDAMGNIFAVRPGKRGGPPTYAGSHMDTQPTGGRYDGILGVHAGIEVLKTMNDLDIKTEYDTGVINWTNEEGARFPISMVSSGVWAGAYTLEKAHNVVEVGGGKATQKSELEKIGYLGPLEASYKANPIGAHFELHIEQGPILESSGGKIGAVDGAQAYKWFTITVKGKDCHTGTTDFENRSDAMLAAAKLILHSHNKATEYGCLASTGILTLRPGSTNTVPGWVQFSLDIRSKEDAIVSKLEESLKEDFQRIASGKDIGGVNAQGTKGRGCSVEWQFDTDSPATKFHEDCIKCVEASARDMLGTNAGSQVKRMTSGAGHDSVYTSRHAPTSMIFVPCREGISHNPAEYCSPEDCGNGAQTLLGAMLRYDRLRAEKGA